MSDYPTDSPSLITRSFLVNNSIFTLPSAVGDWPLYISGLPDGDNIEDNAGAVYDVAPNLDGRLMTSGDVVQHYGISFTIRCTTYEAGWQKCLSILTLLVATAQSDISLGANDYLIEAFSVMSGIVYLGVETGTKRRYLFELTFTVTMRQV